MNYQPGQQYRVLKPSYIEQSVHRGGSSFGFQRHPLNVGVIVEVVGWRNGFGDSPQMLWVEKDGVRGEFGPDSWGSPLPGYLEVKP